MATMCGARGIGWRCAKLASRTVNGEPRCATCGPIGHDPDNEAGADVSARCESDGLDGMADCAGEVASRTLPDGTKLGDLCVHHHRLLVEGGNVGRSYVR